MSKNTTPAPVAAFNLVPGVTCKDIKVAIAAGACTKAAAIAYLSAKGDKLNFVGRAYLDELNGVVKAPAAKPAAAPKVAAPAVAPKVVAVVRKPANETQVPTSARADDKRLSDLAARVSALSAMLDRPSVKAALEADLAAEAEAKAKADAEAEVLAAAEAARARATSPEGRMDRLETMMVALMERLAPAPVKVPAAKAAKVVKTA